jgi:hypothetical protein
MIEKKGSPVPITISCKPGTYRCSLVAAVNSIPGVRLRKTCDNLKEATAHFPHHATGILIFDWEYEEHPAILFERLHTIKRSIGLVGDEAQCGVMERIGVHACMVKGFTMETLIETIEKLAGEINLN